MCAFLMIGAHRSISRLRCDASASGVARSLGMAWLPMFRRLDLNCSSSTADCSIAVSTSIAGFGVCLGA
jgi:hypothetical protein